MRLLLITLLFGVAFAIPTSPPAPVAASMESDESGESGESGEVKASLFPAVPPPQMLAGVPSLGLQKPVAKRQVAVNNERPFIPHEGVPVIGVVKPTNNGLINADLPVISYEDSKVADVAARVKRQLVAVGVGLGGRYPGYGHGHGHGYHGHHHHHHHDHHHGHHHGHHHY